MALLVLLLLLLLQTACCQEIQNAAGLQQEQSAFCQEHAEKLASGWAVDSSLLTQADYDALGNRMKLLVYKQNDIVSYWIQVNRQWEAKSVRNIHKALQSHMKRHSITDPSTLTFVDLGANIGTYTVALAKAGFDVVAFEPMPLNVNSIRAALCLNSIDQSKVTLYPYGLGTGQQECLVFSEDFNHGNGNVECAPNFVVPAGCSKLGMVAIRRYDDFYDQLGHKNVVVLKMDVEGFEPYVVEGGARLFFERPIPYIQMEFNEGCLRQRGSDPLAILCKFIEKGYTVRRGSFGGPIIPSDSITTNTKNCPLSQNIEDLFLIHESVQQNSEQLAATFEL